MPRSSSRTRKPSGAAESKSPEPVSDKDLEELQNQFHFSGRAKRASGKKTSPSPSDEAAVSPKRPTPRKRKKPKGAKIVVKKLRKPRRESKVIYKEDNESESSEELENSSESENEWNQKTSSKIKYSDDESAEEEILSDEEILSENIKQVHIKNFTPIFYAKIILINFCLNF